MQNDYTAACTCISAYRSAYSGKKKGFLIKQTDIADIIASYGNNLDGVRVYIGLDADNDFTAHFVGVIKDANGNYNDVNVENATLKARPCPLMCSTTTNAFS